MHGGEVFNAPALIDDSAVALMTGLVKLAPLHMPPALACIAAHLGNEASLMAWDRGRVLDTSMGFTPLEGVMMGARPGWIDAALVPHLARKMDISAEAVVDRLNHQCGLYGVSGLSRDLRVIGQVRSAGHVQADLAWCMYVFRLLMGLGRGHTVKTMDLAGPAR